VRIPEEEAVGGRDVDIDFLPVPGGGRRSPAVGAAYAESGPEQVGKGLRGEFLIGEAPNAHAFFQRLHEGFSALHLRGWKLDGIRVGRMAGLEAGGGKYQNEADCKNHRSGFHCNFPSLLKTVLLQVLL